MNTKKIAYTGIFCALIAAATMIVKIPIPRTEGYVNLGDGIIFLCAIFLANPFCTIAAAAGSAAADLLLGAGIYVFPTAVIKGAMGFIAAKTVYNKEVGKKMLLGFIAAEAVMIFGYFLFESLFFGFSAAIFALPFNAGVIGVLTGYGLIHFFTKLHLNPKI